MSLFETHSQFGKSEQLEMFDFAPKSIWHTNCVFRINLKKEQKCHYYQLYIQVF